MKVIIVNNFSKYLLIYYIELMGNCCGGGANDGDITMMRGVYTKYGAEHILDERMVAGLRGTDKIILVIKVQALIRGFLDRKRVKKIYGF